MMALPEWKVKQILRYSRIFFSLFYRNARFSALCTPTGTEEPRGSDLAAFERPRRSAMGSQAWRHRNAPIPVKTGAAGDHALGRSKWLPPFPGLAHIEGARVPQSEAVRSPIRFRSSFLTLSM